MPDLYHGPYGEHNKPLMYVPGMRRVESKVFDTFKLDGVAPASQLRHVANTWHWTDKKHTILAWHDPVDKHERQVFIPSLMDQRDALEFARIKFPEVMPSPISFRFAQSHHEVLLYD